MPTEREPRINLRDRFALAVIRHLTARPDVDGRYAEISKIADHAYRIADACMFARRPRRQATRGGK